VDKSITSQDYRTFLRELRAARKRSGLTQADLARRVNESQSFISKCERAERRLDVIELRSFCRAFGTSAMDFVRNLEKSLAKPRHRSRKDSRT
jgi:ribosome-binding protein aMBF1 (putative translation factor)